MDLAGKQNSQYKSDNLWIWPSRTWDKSQINVRNPEDTKVIHESQYDYGTWAAMISNYVILKGITYSGITLGSFTDRSMTTCVYGGYSLGVMFNLSSGKYRLSGDMQLDKSNGQIYLVKFVKAENDLTMAGTSTKFEVPYQKIPGETYHFEYVFDLAENEKIYFKFGSTTMAGQEFVTISDMDLRKVD